MILPYEGKSPRIHKSCYIAPDCVIVGDVTIRAESSVWFKAVIRGDINYIKIGCFTNVQDGCIIHVTGGTSPAEIGDHVVIGHGALIHGCRIEDGCLIGMGSIILDDSIVGEGSLIAAGSVVKPGTVVPPNSMMAGNPAVFKRKVLQEEMKRFIDWAKDYRGYSREYTV
ncbi:MAG: gamma carbonic anhydrase family protein [Candidatus Zixiibacteriota bacterium]|nr:MAG: gamma carbonic anhydrase family protein [candidate division Zixibacteria bacterium]